MKKWGLRILSALLTFTLGLCATAFVRFIFAPAAKLRPVYDGASIQVQPPSTQIAGAAQPPDKADEIMQPHPVSISPYEIKRIIDEDRRTYQALDKSTLNLASIWDQLGLKEDENGFFSDLCIGHCSADISRLELDGKSGKETLLRIIDNTGMDYRYLIFQQEKTSNEHVMWNLLGLVDSSGWYWEPPHRVEVAGTKRWLVIGLMTGHGSGFGSLAENWYEINENGVEPVLSYQTGLFLGAGANPMIDRKTKIYSIEDQKGVTTLVLETSTSYEEYRTAKEYQSYKPLPLWSNKRKATFVREFGAHKFTFDPFHSDISEKDLNSNRDDGVHITDEEFLKYNYYDLARLAVNGSAKQKEWLRNYLETCDDSPEKQSLQKALEGARP